MPEYKKYIIVRAPFPKKIHSNEQDSLQEERRYNKFRARFGGPKFRSVTKVYLPESPNFPKM